MKRLIFTMLILFAIVATVIFGLMLMATGAHAFELQARTSHMIYSNPELKANDGLEIEGLELRLIHKDLFAYGSRHPFEMFGQVCEMYSVGIGYQHPFWDVFRVYLKVGYDMPSYDPNGFCWEPIRMWQVKSLFPVYGDRIFHHYMGEIEPSFTGEIGLDCQKHIWKGLSLGFFGAYKFARHEVATYGLEIDGIPGKTGWQVIDPSVDFGGPKVGMYVELRF